MMRTELLADAEAARRRGVEACNSAARQLINEARGAMRKRAEDVLGVDDERLLRRAMDLVDALAGLRSAQDELQVLRRRDG